MDYAGIGSYEDELNDDDLDDLDDRFGMGMGGIMKNKERLALDMSDLDAIGGGVFSARGARMSDDMPSSGDGEEDWDESGVGWQ